MTHPSPPQITRLYTLASGAGWTRDDVHDWLASRYNLHSSKDLTPRQYEQMTAFLQGVIEGRQRDSDGMARKADAARGFPRLHDKTGLRRLFRQHWPAMVSNHPDLAEDLLEVLDCARLYRRVGTVSPGLMIKLLQKMRKFDVTILEPAAAAYLKSYTTKDERYFLGICRRLRHDALLAQRKAETASAAGSAGVPPASAPQAPPDGPSSHPSRLCGERRSRLTAEQLAAERARAASRLPAGIRERIGTHRSEEQPQ